MPSAPFIPVELIHVMHDLILAVNEGRDIQIIVVAAESHSPPSMVSTIHPEQVSEILQFLIDNKDRADLTVDGQPISNRRH